MDRIDLSCRPDTEPLLFLLNQCIGFEIEGRFRWCPPGVVVGGENLSVDAAAAADEEAEEKSCCIGWDIETGVRFLRGGG